MNHITFILSLKALSGIEETENFIKEQSVPYTFECDESGTRSFEWYLDKKKNNAILLESFKDSEAAVLRVQNLLSSPLNEAFRDLFEVMNLTVLGNASESLIDTLESWKPSYFDYEEGFNKTF